jgi:hypothetical protein
MLLTKQKMMSAFMALTLLTGTGLASFSAPAQAANRYYGNNYYNGYTSRNYSNSRVGNFFQDHPYVQKAAVIGGAGAAVGAIVAGDGNRVNGAVKGALLGAGVGMGYQYLRQQGIIHW